MSELYIKTEYDGEKTIMTDCFFTAPCKVAKPFVYKDHTEIMIMMASAGMLDGDVYNHIYEIGERSRVKITGQSYTKIFKCEKSGVEQNVKITAGENAVLYYCPCPVIPFGESIFSSKTEFHIKRSSVLMFCDIFACGREAMGERFLFTSYLSKNRVYIDDVPVFWDFTRLIPKETELSGIGFFEGYSHIGLIYIYGKEIEQIPKTDGLETSMTKAAAGVCIKVLGNSADEIVCFFKDITEKYFA